MIGTADVLWLFSLLRAGLGAVFLMLGCAVMIVWRQDQAQPQPAPRAGRGALPWLAWLFLMIGLQLAQGGTPR